MLTNGQKLDGRYIILEEIGSGGFGAVYLAEDTRFSGNNRVAIKKIILAGQETDQAFRQEADLLYNLSHPNLPKVSNCFKEGSACFIVMDYISGEDLMQKLKRGVRFTIPEVLHIADKVLDALEYLHSFLIFHRDVKPHNIKIDDDGRIFLLDFGTAKGSIDETTLTQRTSGQSVTGFTPFYAPLEQILRVDTNSYLLLQTTDSPFLESFLDNKTDARSDIYSLGATLYHLLTNFSPEKATATIRAHAIWSNKPEPMPDCQQLNPEIPDALAAVIERCLEILPEKRFQSAADLRHTLKNLDDHWPPHSISEDKTVPISAEYIPIQKPADTSLPAVGQPVEDTVHFIDLREDTGNSEKSEPVSPADSFESIYPPQPPPPPEIKKSPVAKLVFFASLAVMILTLTGLGTWLAVRNWKKTPAAETGNLDKPERNIRISNVNAEKGGENETARSMDYSLLVQKMRDGKKYQEPFESSGQEVFENGYEFQMRFTPPGEGFLYIFAEGLNEQGEKIYNMIFPTPERNDGKTEVAAGKQYETGWNVFGGKPGTENFWLIWNKDKEDFLEQARDTAFKSDTGELTDGGLKQKLKDYLESGRQKKIEASKETAEKLTKLSFSGDSAVYLIELEHR